MRLIVQAIPSGCSAPTAEEMACPTWNGKGTLFRETGRSGRKPHAHTTFHPLHQAKTKVWWLGLSPFHPHRWVSPRVFKPIADRMQTHHMTNAAAFPAELWGIDELAEHLGTSKDFAYTLVAERKIGHLRIGKLVRFTPEHVLHYQASVAVAVETRHTGRRASPVAQDSPAPAAGDVVAPVVRNIGGRPRAAARNRTSAPTDKVFS